MAYPLYLYGPDETFRIVSSDAERDQAVAEGFWAWSRDVSVSAPDTAVVIPQKRGPGRPRKLPQESES